MAIAASIIGSQAMISCAFATVSHLQSLSCFPRVKILHTSKRFPGQLYIPGVNFLLCVAACVVTVSFKTTVIIGKAHGNNLFHLYIFDKRIKLRIIWFHLIVPIFLDQCIQKFVSSL